MLLFPFSVSPPLPAAHLLVHTVLHSTNLHKNIIYLKNKVILELQEEHFQICLYHPVNICIILLLLLYYYISILLSIYG